MPLLGNSFRKLELLFVSLEYASRVFTKSSNLRRCVGTLECVIVIPCSLNIKSEFMVWSLNRDANGSYSSLVDLYVDNYQVTMKQVHPNPIAQYAGIELVSNSFNHPLYLKLLPLQNPT